jgi:hypothetical protein
MESVTLKAMPCLATQLKRTLRDLTGVGFFSTLRWVEPRITSARLSTILNLMFYARAACNTVLKIPGSPAVLPEYLQSFNTLPIRIRRRADPHLNRVVEFFQDRLAQASWRNQCRIDGLGYLQAARQKRRAVILAFCHFGPFRLLAPWLRAAGFPAGVMLAGKTPALRTRSERFRERILIRPDVLLEFYRDRWRKAPEFLRAGHPLLVAIDVSRGKQLRVPFGRSWTVQIAAGAVRLAMRHHAELMPCCIIQEGAWHYRIKLGPPVPQDYLAAGTDGLCAGRSLIDEMLPLFRSRPEQCSSELLRCLKPSAPVAALETGKSSLLTQIVVPARPGVFRPLIFSARKRSSAEVR